MQNDTKIMREVNALSRLNHRCIVRYYTTWIETVDAPSAAPSDDSSAESSRTVSDESNYNEPSTFTTTDGSGSEGAMTSMPLSRADEQFLPVNGGFGLNIDVEDFDDMSESQSSFPSIHFEGSRSPQNSDSEGDDSFDTLFTAGAAGGSRLGNDMLGAPSITRTLYIQMVSALLCWCAGRVLRWSAFRNSSRGRLFGSGWMRAYQRTKLGGCSTRLWML